MRVTHSMYVNHFTQNLARNQRRQIQLYTQASSGIRLHRPSDDPLAVSRVMRFDSELVDIERFLSNALDARDWLGATDAALQEVHNVLHRARELVILAANGTLADTDREAAADELGQLLEHLVEVANTQYKGRYLFAGTETLTKPFTLLASTDPVDGHVDYQVQYHGNDGAIERTIGPGVLLQVNQDGGVLEDVLEVLATAVEHMRANDVASLSGSDLAEIDRVVDELLRIRSAVGARMNRAEWTGARLTDLSLQVPPLSPGLRDADVARVLVDLRAVEVTLQTSMAAAARMFDTTLVNFLR
ncbi:MAG: flagellar hook-associated protein 3 [Bacillota bacterium]|nr:MAG: flagellar hook-associated protein 3 [Bacillota bacterium]